MTELRSRLPSIDGNCKRNCFTVRRSIDDLLPMCSQLSLLLGNLSYQTHGNGQLCMRVHAICKWTHPMETSLPYAIYNQPNVWIYVWGFFAIVFSVIWNHWTPPPSPPSPLPPPPSLSLPSLIFCWIFWWIFETVRHISRVLFEDSLWSFGFLWHSPGFYRNHLESIRGCLRLLGPLPPSPLAPPPPPCLLETKDYFDMPQNRLKNDKVEDDNLTVSVRSIGTVSSRFSYILRFLQAVFRIIRRKVVRSMAHKDPCDMALFIQRQIDS